VIRSMTGFGKAAREYRGDAVTIELSAVNHRFLDASVRLPGEWAAMDQPLREVLRERIARGKLNVTISRKRADGSTTRLRLDKGLAQQYIDRARELAHLLGSDEPVTLETIAGFDNIFVAEGETEDLDALREFLAALVNAALDSLDTMRANEGRALAKDLMDRLGLIRASLAEIETRLPQINALYTERLRQRIGELAQSTDIAQERLAMEVALAAERGDVTEETVRLKSHLDHARELIDGKEAAGRKLNFLLQEMQREANTLGSKVRDTEVVRHVLDIKSELERLREQIQNIE
jgi:uncharacterized protein (TIGR00255 family)